MKKRSLIIILGLIVTLGGYCTQSEAGNIWLGSPGYSTLAETVAAIGGSNIATNLIVPPGTYDVNSDLNIPNNIAIRVMYGANIRIASGVTLTIQGPFTAGPYRVFTDNSGSAAKGIKFAYSSGVSFVSPEWWGAVGNNSVNCAPAINQAINAAGFLSDGLYRIPVQLNAAHYVCFSTLNVLNGTILRGVTPMNSMMANNTILDLWQYSNCPLIAGHMADNIYIENLTLKTKAGCTGKLIYLYGGGSRGAIKGCQFYTSGYPNDANSYSIYLDNHSKITISGNFFAGHGGVYMNTQDSQFDHNELYAAKVGVILNGANIKFNNNIIYLCGTGLLLGSLSGSPVINNNRFDQCSYGLRNSAAVPVFITGNSFASDYYGYFCNSPTATAIIDSNLFAGPGTTQAPIDESAPAVSILVNGGQHTITNNHFCGTENIAGSSSYSAYNNFGIDVY